MCLDSLSIVAGPGIASTPWSCRHPGLQLCITLPFGFVWVSNAETKTAPCSKCCLLSIHTGAEGAPSLVSFLEALIVNLKREKT
jgi:hypothetical protein